MKSVCIFLGAHPGANPVYARAAEAMGRELAARGLTCVYGGSNTGLMKRLADCAMENGGKVIGVTVDALKDREIFHPGLTDLHVVHSMSERKELMMRMSDGFIALPGGVGTLDELFEVYTWRLLGYHEKPIGLLDVGRYYAPLDAMLETAVQEGFLKGAYRDMLVRADNPSDLLDRLGVVSSGSKAE